MDDIVLEEDVGVDAKAVNEEKEKLRDLKLTRSHRCSNKRSEVNKMSIEDQSANLSLSDKPALLEVVTSTDVIASDLVGTIHVLAGKADSRDDAKAVSSLILIKALADVASDAKAMMRLCLAACLENAGNKNKAVGTVATNIALAPFCITSNPFAMRSLLPVFFRFIIFDPGINTTRLERRQQLFYK